MSSSVVPVKRALLSVFDKTGLLDFAAGLHKHGVELLSTGGTAKALRDAGIPVIDVADVTKWPEMLGGRVKTLHPVVHAGLLADRQNMAHMAEMAAAGLETIDLVVSNLYPFQSTVASGKPFSECIEMIDIGGATMIRAAAKNCASVAVVTDPGTYAAILAALDAAGGTDETLRRDLALRAFIAVTEYDAAVAEYFGAQTGDTRFQTRCYVQERALKYGVNPHQKPAAVSRLADGKLPFTVLNGAPGYTNLMDALNGWQLVRELEAALGLPAATSFKHVSPAGAAVAIPLTPELAEVYHVADKALSPQAVAYVRARNADPMSSFGDFVAVSGTADITLAEYLRLEVSDGIIAAAFDADALAVLAAKKGGKYIVLQGDVAFVPPVDEYKEVYGVALSQKRNVEPITPALMDNVVTTAKISADALRDLLLATITVKYTQSNSVCYALGGQIVGVGAGQQSRVDCVRLAGRKVDQWHLRSHEKVRSLKFKEGTKRPDKVNARVSYINAEMTPAEEAHFAGLLAAPAPEFTAAERKAHMAALKGVAVSSDAFFPFRDNIDVAAKHGVSFVAQPGGSVADDVVINACNEHGIAMAFTGLRLFHH